MSLLRKIIAGTMVMSSVALASETRVDTLQNIGGIQDETDTFTYAGRVTHYSLALLELGTSDDAKTWAAAMTKLSPGLSMGVAVNRHTWQSSYFADENSLLMQDRFMFSALADSKSGADDAVFAPGDRSIDVLAGFALNDSDSFGLRLSMAKERAKVSSTTASTSTEQTTSATELGAGYSSVGGSAIDVGFSLLLSDDYKYADVTAGSKTGAELKAKATVIRGRWLASAKSSGLFAEGVLATRSSKATVTKANVDKTGKFSEQEMKASVGYVHAPEGQSTKMFASADLYKTSSKGPKASGNADTFASTLSTSSDAVKVDAQWINASLSGEGKFMDNFGAMFGTSYTLMGSVVEKDNLDKTKSEAEITSPSDSNMWSLGLFWATEKARVDASFAKKLLHNGPYFVAGNTTSPMLTRISATVNF